ncbi:MAG: hypothetical protein JKX98_05205 [Alcanivoracaceae bacterium]|nr:hypothetical protein [Alcanivoracaceae bacterium]
MIHLSQQLCDQLDLTYWQLKQPSNESVPVKLTISTNEKELLGKILLAKGIKLNDQMLEIKADGVIVIKLANHQLIFNNVNSNDTENTTHLATISAMLQDPEQKKLTWRKLKNLDL